MKNYTVVWTDKSKKQLKKMDKSESRLIIAWVKKNLEGVENPRILGKSLKGNLAEFWRYKVGDYRIIALIEDSEVKIQIMETGHRKNIYQQNH